ncbi:hypothetical protein ABET51_12890 [Metabacillus fastidiosus]|uniref:hypothetical protein n=1 Tax=Metabacillus fastidiosus TaxID=1458 RepID=UPI003D2B9713
MNTNTNFKQELSLKTEQHSKLITNIVEKAFTGIKTSEIVELRNIYEKNRYTYYNKIKLKYIGLLGLLALNYNVTEEVENNIFFLIHDIIHKITVNTNDDSELTIQLS